MFRYLCTVFQSSTPWYVRGKSLSAWSSVNMLEWKPVRGKQDFPLAIASWLVYLLTGWERGWGRGWTYGLLKHGLVIGRPRNPKGWADGLWSLSPSILPAWTTRTEQPSSQIQQQRSVSSCSQSLLLPTPLTPRDGEVGGGSLQLGNWLTPSAFPVQKSVVLLWALSLRDHKNQSCERTCWCRGPTTKTSAGLISWIRFPVDGYSTFWLFVKTQHEDNTVNNIRSLGFWSQGLSVTYQLLQLSHTDHCTDTDSHTHTLEVYVFMDTLTLWDQGANIHTWSHALCIDEQAYAHTHIHSLWVSDLICTYLHILKHSGVTRAHVQPCTLKVSSMMDSSPDVLWQNRLLAFISTCLSPIRWHPQVPRRERSCRRIRGAAGEMGTIETMSGTANDSGTSCFCQRPHKMGIDVNSIVHHVVWYMNDRHQISGLSCTFFQVNASEISSNKPLSPIVEHIPTKVQAQRRTFHLLRKIQRMMSEPWLVRH